MTDISWHAADGRMYWTLLRMVMTVTNRSSKHFRKKYPVISSLYGQHTDTAEDIHISTIGFEGNPKEWYISMRIYGEMFDDLLHGNLLMNVAFASAVGNLCMASVDVFKEIMKSDAKQPKILLKELTGIDEIDKNFDFGNYLDARNPETGEIISTAREDGKASGVELPEEIECHRIWRCIQLVPIYFSSRKR